MRIVEYTRDEKSALMRKVCLDATPAELAEQQAAERQAFYEEVNQPLTLVRKLELFVDSIPVLPQPRAGSRPGYLWRPMYDSEGHCFGWEEIPDPYYTPTQSGTYIDPIPYTEGMAVTGGMWYKFPDDNIWEAVRSGSGSVYATDWFEIIT